MITKRLIVSSILLGAMATSVVAQRGGGRRGRGGDSGEIWKFMVGKYDANKDGKISAKEYARDQTRFKELDTNGDGSLSQEDFAGGRRRRGGGRDRGRGQTAVDIKTVTAKMLGRSADGDGDKTVTAAEWNAAATRLDKNADKILDANELGDLLRSALGRSKMSTRAVGRRLKHFDTDRDRKVQVKEVHALFASLDSNGDQRLVSAELQIPRGAGRSGPPKVGEIAPDFDLPLVKDPKTTIRLSSFKGDRPVALIFGSYT